MPITYAQIKVSKDHLEKSETPNSEGFFNELREKYCLPARDTEQGRKVQEESVYEEWSFCQVFTISWNATNQFEVTNPHDDHSAKYIRQIGEPKYLSDANARKMTGFDKVLMFSDGTEDGFFNDELTQVIK